VHAREAATTVATGIRAPNSPQEHHMPLSPVTPVTSGPSTAVGPIAAGPAKPADSASDTWMKLLLAQARNPNPFGENDPTATVAQMAQFQMVSELNELGDLLRGQAASGQVQAATSMLGRTVSWLDSDGSERTGVATGVRVTTDGALVAVGDQEVSLSKLRTVKA